jgi:tetratricopeptide (TPR) repeat protein
LAYSLLGEIYMKIQQYDNSAAALEKATELNPWSFKDFFNLGRVYELMERFAEAVRAYSRAAQLEPQDLQANIGAARSYYKIEDYPNASLFAEQAEQLAPNDSEVHELLGDIYGKTNDYEQAIPSYKRALELDSNNPDIMTSLAVAYLKTKRPSPAYELLKTVVQIQPANEQAHKYLGYISLVLYLEDKNAYEAEQQSASPDEVMVESLKRSMANYLDESVASYEKAVALDEQDWDAHRGLGVAYIWKATTAAGGIDEALKEKALQQWRRSLEINPQQTYRDTLLRYIRIYSRQGSGG